MAQGSVKVWHEEEGWGVLESPDVPGDVFAHFSEIDAKGYRSLKPGSPVEFEYEDAVPGGQDGCPYVASGVTALDD